jgi:putative membrane protein
MKTHITRHLLVLLTGTTLAIAAENRVIPSDPGSASGNTGSAGAGTTGQYQNPPAENTPGTTNPYTPGVGTTRDTSGMSTTDTLAGPGTGAALKGSDQRFLEKMNRLNEREVALSRQAAQRATTPQVRSFAEEMIREHQQAGQELGTLATRKGARLESMSTRTAREIEKDWADKTGRDYDKAYVNAIIDAHEDTIDVLENGVDSKDPEIAATAQKLLPKVKAHLERAESLHKMLD